MQATEVKPDYCFPVTLENIYTKDGTLLKRHKAVVRKDSGAPLSVVGEHYNLIPHETILNAVKPYLTSIGNFQEKYVVDRNGSRVAATYDFKDVTETTKVGDVVGLRIIAFNSYDASGAFLLRVGGLVLKCLNGMTTLNNPYTIRILHNGFTENLVELPPPEKTIKLFKNAMGMWDMLSDIKVPDKTVAELTESIKLAGVLSLKSLSEASVIGQIEKSENAWDLYNAYTYGITHTLKTSSIAAQVNRSDRLNRIFVEKLALA